MLKPTAFENNIEIACAEELMMMPNGIMFSMDGQKTRLNNNVIAMGTSGSSKTRSVIAPNLLACVNSYVVSDPKGNLCDKYGDYLKSKGYRVIKLDFIHPERSDGYNPLMYVRTPDEIMKLSHYITYAGKTLDNAHVDPYWDRQGELLLSAIIGYMVDMKTSSKERTMTRIGRLMALIDADRLEEHLETELCKKMKEMNIMYEREHGETSWGYAQYQKFIQVPPKTLNTIISTIHANIGSLDTPELNAMYAKPSIKFEDIGTEKTVVFVIVSDSDRSRDILINTFYSQAMNALCSFADEKCENSRLPIPVRFMLDDFGTNCKIDGFENIISNIRSRNISATIALQSISQLSDSYAESSHTIVDNCDTLIYMGGNDVTTAETIAKRANKMLSTILDMPVGTNWVFRRGQKPVFSRTIDLDEYSTLRKIYSGEYKKAQALNC